VLDENDVATATRNPCVKKSSEDSLLHILQPKRVKNAFENENKESNLFHLFAGRSLFEAILAWTNIPRSENCNSPRSRDCFLCGILGTERTGAAKKSTTFGCYECGLHYHLPCFNKRHHVDFNSSTFNTAMSLALQTEKAKKKRTSADIANPRDA
jgi:hypothetical protein